MKTLFYFFFLVITGFVVTSGVAYAEDIQRVVILKDHYFTPQDIEVPEGKRVMLIIDNQDATPELFKSHDLHLQKTIPANSKVVLFINPLKSGVYKFLGELNQNTAQGEFVVFTNEELEE